jgi:hypothetical protein
MSLTATPWLSAKRYKSGAPIQTCKGMFLECLLHRMRNAEAGRLRTKVLGSADVTAHDDY